MLKHLLLLSILLFTMACKKPTKKDCPYKDQVCDTANFTLINRTQDTVFYGIGSNMLEDTLLPAQQRVIQYAEVNVRFDENCNEIKQSWSTHQLSSNFGSWAFNIDHCDKKSAFEYDSNQFVKLYDVTEE